MIAGGGGRVRINTVPVLGICDACGQPAIMNIQGTEVVGSWRDDNGVAQQHIKPSGKVRRYCRKHAPQLGLVAVGGEEG